MSFDTNPESRDDACDKEGDGDCAQTREAVSAKPLRMPSRFGAASAMCQTRAFAAGPSIASRDVGGAIRDLKIPDERGRLMGSAHVPVPVGFRRLPAPAETARYDSWGECPRTPAGGHRPHGPAFGRVVRCDVADDMKAPSADSGAFLVDFPAVPNVVLSCP